MKRFLFMLCLLVSLNAIKANATEKIRVAFVEAPPLSYLDSNNIEKGKLIELFRDVSQSLELAPEFIYVPHKRKLQFIHEGKVDMWAGQKNSRVGDSIALTSRTSLFSMNLRVFWKKGEQHIESFGDLENSKLILIASYSYGGRYTELENGASDVIYAINHEDGMKKLFDNEGYYLLGYQEIANSTIKKYEINDVESTSLASYALYLKLSKRYPSAKQLMQKIDGYLHNSH